MINVNYDSRVSTVIGRQSGGFGRGNKIKRLCVG